LHARGLTRAEYESFISQIPDLTWAIPLVIDGLPRLRYEVNQFVTSVDNSKLLKLIREDLLDGRNEDLLIGGPKFQQKNSAMRILTVLAIEGENEFALEARALLMELYKNPEPIVVKFSAGVWNRAFLLNHIQPGLAEIHEERIIKLLTTSTYRDYWQETAQPAPDTQWPVSDLTPLMRKAVDLLYFLQDDFEFVQQRIEEIRSSPVEANSRGTPEQAIKYKVQQFDIGEISVSAKRYVETIKYGSPRSATVFPSFYKHPAVDMILKPSNVTNGTHSHKFLSLNE